MAQSLFDAHLSPLLMGNTNIRDQRQRRPDRYSAGIPF
jgi:hypothetical protein